MSPRIILDPLPEAVIGPCRATSSRSDGRPAWRLLRAVPSPPVAAIASIPNRWLDVCEQRRELSNTKTVPRSEARMQSRKLRFIRTRRTPGQGQPSDRGIGHRADGGAATGVSAPRRVDSRSPVVGVSWERENRNRSMLGHGRCPMSWHLRFLLFHDGLNPIPERLPPTTDILRRPATTIVASWMPEVLC